MVTVFWGIFYCFTVFVFRKLKRLQKIKFTCSAKSTIETLGKGMKHVEG